ncbi:la-related protein 6C [Senna tora]|uniref:La-related protein 6C n=1 Tax=Senna tora TaxID=362788 RepID=A0A835CGP6_9FABA|nr:la-related protein 6C [Senna tora]
MERAGSWSYLARRRSLSISSSRRSQNYNAHNDNSENDIAFQKLEILGIELFNLFRDGLAAPKSITEHPKLPFSNSNYSVMPLPPHTLSPPSQESNQEHGEALLPQFLDYASCLVHLAVFGILGNKRKTRDSLEVQDTVFIILFSRRRREGEKAISSQVLFITKKEMAEAEELKEKGESKSMEERAFKFNIEAPEFVPRSHTQMPISGYFYPCFQFLGGAGDSDWYYSVDDQEIATPMPTTTCSVPSTEVMPNCSKNVLTQDLQQKIVKQVEYQFSDMSLLANESFQKQINRDPEGYVPISIIASSKKIKSLISNNTHLLTQALSSSSKLSLSADNKKVKRKHPFTEKEKEELQSRTVVAENLPEDHSFQNLQKIFSVVGSLKTLRICYPHDLSTSPRLKGDIFISNKLHALVEYKTTDLAEKAVEKLNDERNWRKGMRVRMLIRRTPRSVLKGRKSEFDGFLDDDEISDADSTGDSPHPICSDVNSSGDENPNAYKKGGWGRGLSSKGRGCSQSYMGRGLLASPHHPSSFVQSEASPRQSPKGPRMPDGTRGFAIGRGKPVNPPAIAS